MALLLSASCQRTPDQDLNKKVLRWAAQSDTPTLDPHGTSNNFALAWLGNSYEPLVRLNNEMKIEPALAINWELMEPRRWRFKLREGVTFHNGNEFNADDVVFSFNRIASEYSVLRDRVALVTDIIKIDDYTVDFITQHPSPILPGLWTSLYIMDKEWSEENGAVFPANAAQGIVSFAGQNENGTGPFTLVFREPEVRTEFERYAAWWDQSPVELDKVVFTPISHNGTRVAALLAGDVECNDSVARAGFATNSRA